MESTLFLSAKIIVSHMTRDELKCLEKIAILFRSSTPRVKAG
jgi:hypothetical protein